MSQLRLPRYPIYIPSKGRWQKSVALTARVLIHDQIPFKLVVEPQEHEQYATAFGEQYILELPFSNRGSVIPARNWIKEHSIQQGHARHWQLDDNIRYFRRRYQSKRITCNAGIALGVVEDFSDRYENVAIAGLNYDMFLPDKIKCPPFYLNCHVYSCSLVNNAIPHQWRGRYNEDTDICLQVLASGWCTVLFNAFSCAKIWTMQTPGGNTESLYKGDGRLRMAKSLERMWPGVVETRRRFQRPQHVVKDAWRRFDTPLKLKEGTSLDDYKDNDYQIELRKLGQAKSNKVNGIFDGYEGPKTDETTSKAGS